MKVIFLFKGRKLFHTQWHYISVWVCMFCLLDNHNCKLHLHEVNISFFAISLNVLRSHTLRQCLYFWLKKLKALAQINIIYVIFCCCLKLAGVAFTMLHIDIIINNVAKHFISEIISLTICVTYATYRKV